MRILPNENILLEYVVRWDCHLCSFQAAVPLCQALQQSVGLTVGRWALSLSLWLDVQCLWAGLSTRLAELPHPGGVQPVTIAVLTALTADYIGCPSPLFQMLFFHMFEIFHRLDRKLYLVLALRCTGSPSERFILCLVMYSFVSRRSRLCN